MIPYEVDPSLHSAQLEAPSLDDGFSAPAGPRELIDPKLRDAPGAVGLQEALAGKSEF